MKRFPQGELRLDEKALFDNLGRGNFIFVGSSTDMFAEEVPSKWIYHVLGTCGYYNNTYLFQTKNPKRFAQFFTCFPENSILGTTIETNYSGTDYQVSKAPSVIERISAMVSLKGKKMISIEPIMDFDLEEFVDWIKDIKPKFVSIGADSKNHNLPEPSKEKTLALIKELQKFTKVIVKDNLKRIIGKENHNG